MMQTIDLGATFVDDTLEGVVLGIVYTASQAPDPPRNSDSTIEEQGVREAGDERGRPVFVGDVKEGRKGGFSDENESKGKILGCFEHAARKVGERRQMEGVLEFGWGRVSFLVYRID
jgi:hypothetical protein